jgi:acetyltransferase-like isoleucine patch superfamily enzyme
MNSQKIEVVGEGEVRVGARVSVGEGVQVIFSRPGTVTVSDYCVLGPGVKIICDGGDVRLGDWTTLHDRCLVLSTAGVTVGQHGWFGQGTVIDGTGGLEIGNGVRVGMYSQIWSHVAAGEQIEGCTLFGTRPVCIEDDVWLVGSCIVASGVTLGRRTIALIGSNITKSWPANSVIAGSPAAAKPGLNFYRELTSTEKWKMLSCWVEELGSQPDLRHFTNSDLLGIHAVDGDRGQGVMFTQGAARSAELADQFPNATICCVENKSHRKQLSDIEHRVLKALAGNKARFLALP